MCSPALLAGGLQIGGIGLDAFAKNKAFRKERENSLIDFRRDTEDLGARGVEIQESTSEDILTRALQGASDRAAARASGQGRGLSAVTTSALIREQGFATTRALVLTRENSSRQLKQIDRQKEEAKRRAESRQRNTPRASVLGTALQIGGAATSSFGAFKKGG